MEKATFGAGCFWGVEDAFRRVEGVVETEVGYAGGTVDDPTYEEVCTGRTGHTEVVQVLFDPALVSYEALLDTFWQIHDPAYPHKPQYQSVIFTHTPAQQEAAEASKRRRQELTGKRVYTEILPAPAFWPAEEYHQQYYAKTGRRSCG